MPRDISSASMSEVGASAVADVSGDYVFGTPVMPDAMNGAFIIAICETESTGGNEATVSMYLDLNADGTADEWVGAVASNASGLTSNPNGFSEGTMMTYVPPGVQVIIQNSRDPNGTNTITEVTQITV